MSLAISGKNGTAVIGSSTMCATDWSVNIATERLNVNSTCSLGNNEFIAGFKGVTGSVTAHNKVLTGGSIVAVSVGNSLITVSGSALVDIEASNPIEGVVEFTSDIQFTGAVTTT